MTERQLADDSNIVPAVLPGGTAAVFPDLPPDVAARIEQSMASSRSTGTRRAYASAWRRFETWCAATGYISLPAHPATVAASYGGRPVNDGMVKRWHAPSCVPPLPVAGMVIDASGR
ncbi:hypothetical protein [Rhodococcus sp. PML026]|jgi:hypothetical protein|uniref:hypothetical protein n=1 Tax=Rhodococcus sp. PML026 TaxID=1356405 RepID=UPI0005F80F03|nr:hypothetical protein [Rhodococcus sp. PML026]